MSIINAYDESQMFLFVLNSEIVWLLDIRGHDHFRVGPSSFFVGQVGVEGIGISKGITERRIQSAIYL